jgi:hypothetical protein
VRGGRGRDGAQRILDCLRRIEDEVFPEAREGSDSAE